MREETAPGDDVFPDAHDDLVVIHHVNRMGLGDCRRLYARIAGRDVRSARRIAGIAP